MNLDSMGAATFIKLRWPTRLQLVDRTPNELQTAFGLLLLCIPMAVRPLQYPLSCLAPVWFIIIKLLICKDPTIGSHVRFTLLQVSSFLIGTLYGACVISLAKVITTTSGAELAVLCVLGPLLALPINATRLCWNDPVWIAGVKATIMYGTTIILAQPYPNAADVWTQVVAWLCVSLLTSSTALLLACHVVLPTTAASQLVHHISLLLGDAAKELESCMHKLCLPPELDDKSLSMHGHVLRLSHADLSALNHTFGSLADKKFGSMPHLQGASGNAGATGTAPITHPSPLSRSTQPHQTASSAPQAASPAAPPVAPPAAPLPPPPAPPPPRPPCSSPDMHPQHVLPASSSSSSSDLPPSQPPELSEPPEPRFHHGMQELSMADFQIIHSQHATGGSGAQRADSHSAGSENGFDLRAGASSEVCGPVQHTGLQQASQQRSGRPAALDGRTAAPGGTSLLQVSPFAAAHAATSFAAFGSVTDLVHGVGPAPAVPLQPTPPPSQPRSGSLKAGKQPATPRQPAAGAGAGAAEAALGSIAAFSQRSYTSQHLVATPWPQPSTAGIREGPLDARGTDEGASGAGCREGETVGERATPAQILHKTLSSRAPAMMRVTASVPAHLAALAQPPTVLHDELEEEQFMEMMYRATQPPTGPRLPSFKLELHQPGMHFLPTSPDMTLRRAYQAAAKLLASATAEYPCLHWVSAWWAEVTSHQGAWRHHSLGRLLQACCCYCSCHGACQHDSMADKAAMQAEAHEAAAAAAACLPVCRRFVAAEWQLVLQEVGTLLDSLSALEAVARDMEPAQHTLLDEALRKSVAHLPSLENGAPKQQGGVWGLWLAPHGPRFVRRQDEDNEQGVGSYAHHPPDLHTVVRSALGDASVFAGSLCSALKEWPLPGELLAADQDSAGGNCPQDGWPHGQEQHQQQQQQQRDDGWLDTHIGHMGHSIQWHKRALSDAMLRRTQAYWSYAVQAAKEPSLDNTQMVRLSQSEQLRAQYFVALCAHGIMCQLERLTQLVRAACARSPAAQHQPTTPLPTKASQLHATGPATTADQPMTSPPTIFKGLLTAAARCWQRVAARLPDWAVNLWDMAVLRLWWLYIWECACQAWATLRQGKPGLQAALQSHIVWGVIKYWGVTNSMLVAILCLQGLLPHGSLAAPPIFAFVTAAVVMRMQTESTFGQVVLRVLGAFVGCTVAYLLMSNPDTANNPYLVSGLIIGVASAMSFLVRTQLRWLVYIITISFVSVTACQYRGCCGHTGSLKYAIERLVNVVVGCVLPLLVSNTLRPWYLRSWALGRAADSYTAATSLLQQQYDQLVAQLGLDTTGGTARGAAAGAERAMSRQASVRRSKSGGLLARLSRALSGRQPSVSSLPAGSPDANPTLNATSTKAGCSAVSRQPPASPSSSASPPKHAYSRPGLSASGGLADVLEAEAETMPEACSAAVVANRTQAQQQQQQQGQAGALGAGAYQDTTSEDNAMVVVAVAVEPPPAQVPPPTPTVTQAQVQAPLTEVANVMLREATLWMRGLMSTPQSVHAVMAAATLLALRLAAFQVALQGAQSLSSHFSSWIRQHMLAPLDPEMRRVLAGIQELAGLCMRLLTCELASSERTALAAALHEQVVQVVHLRAHAHKQHLVLRQALHVKVIQLARERAAALLSAAAEEASDTEAADADAEAAETFTLAGSPLSNLPENVPIEFGPARQPSLRARSMGGALARALSRRSGAGPTSSTLARGASLKEAMQQVEALGVSLARAPSLARAGTGSGLATPQGHSTAGADTPSAPLAKLWRPARAPAARAPSGQASVPESSHIVGLQAVRAPSAAGSVHPRPAHIISLSRSPSERSPLTAAAGQPPVTASSIHGPTTAPVHRHGPDPQQPGSTHETKAPQLTSPFQAAASILPSPPSPAHPVRLASTPPAGGPPASPAGEVLTVSPQPSLPLYPFCAAPPFPPPALARQMSRGMSLLVARDQFHPSDSVAWLACLYALTHAIDTAVHFARVVLAAVGSADTHGRYSAYHTMQQAVVGPALGLDVGPMCCSSTVASMSARHSMQRGAASPEPHAALKPADQHPER